MSLTSLKYEILTEELRVKKIELQKENRRLLELNQKLRRKRNGFNADTTRPNNQKYSITNGSF